MTTEELEFSRVNRAVYNPRHSLRPQDREWKEIEASLEEFGQVETLVFNRRTGNLVGGHQRMTIMESKGKTSAAFSIVDLSLEDEKRLNVVLNKVGGRWDHTKLGPLLAEMKVAGLDLASLGFNAMELNHLFQNRDKQSKRDPDEVDAPGKEDLATTQPGDLFKIVSPAGLEHRLICGDSEDPDTHARLMDGQKARVIFTDPPYGISYAKSLKGHDAIINDKLRAQALFDFLANVFKAAAPHCVRNPALYCFYAVSNHIIFETALNQAGWSMVQQLIWNKGLKLSRSHYHWSHEPIIYGGLTGENPEWFGDRSQQTVLETVTDISKLKKEELVAILTELLKGSDVIRQTTDKAGDIIHPTQKPAGLSARLLHNSSAQGEIAVDYFGGSGSTMVGAELAGRRCFMAEGRRAFCDAILRRMDATFGVEITKL